MHPSTRPLGPRPNYTLRRLVAVTVLVLFLLLVVRVVGAITGDGDDDSLATGATSSSTTMPPIEAPPPCEDLDDQSVYSDVDDWYRTIVDTQYALPDQYEPPDLVPASEANYSGEFRIRAVIAEDLNRMRSDLFVSGNPEVALLAAYRSIEDQRALFARREADMGYERAATGTARAGHSEHHLGTTVDVRLIGDTDVDESFGDTLSGRWLAENSWKYGFILSYPEGKQDVTCYKYEPWHFRYVGVDLADRVHNSGLTLREYLWHWEVTGSEPGIPNSAVTTSSTTVPTTAGE